MAPDRDSTPEGPGLVHGIDTPVLVASVSLAIAYGLRSGFGSLVPADVWVAVKGLSVVLLSISCLRAGRRWGNPEASTVGAALGFHAVGDVLIARGALLAAMAFFFLGHLGYIAAFLRARRRAPGQRAAAPVRYALCVVLLGWGVWMMIRLMPAMSAPFNAAIPIYSTALLGMACCAVLVARVDAPTVGAALLYVYSDSVIAWDRFLGLSPAAAVLEFTTWPTYFVAQLLFARWALRAVPPKVEAGREASV